MNSIPNCAGYMVDQDINNLFNVVNTAGTLLMQNTFYPNFYTIFFDILGNYLQNSMSTYYVTCYRTIFGNILTANNFYNPSAASVVTFTPAQMNNISNCIGFVSSSVFNTSSYLISSNIGNNIGGGLYRIQGGILGAGPFTMPSQTVSSTSTVYLTYNSAKQLYSVGTTNSTGSIPITAYKINNGPIVVPKSFQWSCY